MMTKKWLVGKYEKFILSVETERYVRHVIRHREAYNISILKKNNFSFVKRRITGTQVPEKNDSLLND